jgi:hypothetical protein
MEILIGEACAVFVGIGLKEGAMVISYFVFLADRVQLRSRERTR